MAKAGFRLPSALALMSLLMHGCGGGGGGGATGGAGSGGGSTVPPPNLPSVSLTATPSTLFAGMDTTLTWNTSSARDCMASGAWEGARPTSGSELIRQVQRTSSFTLTCSNARGESAASATVAVSDSADHVLPTLTFTASPTLLSRGDPVTLSWSATNMDWCYAGWIFSGDAARPTQGVEVLTDRTGSGSPTRTFDIQCGNAEGINLRRYATIEISTFAGELVVPGGIWADIDVNDPNAPNTGSNDVDGTPISEISVVPGYVNVPLSGPPGRSYESGDPVDVFRADLRQGQIVRLTLPTVDLTRPPAERDDGDLYLYDINGDLVDASISLNAAEALQITTDGRYDIEVRAVSGGFNYLLSLEPPASVQSLSNERASANFVPGEAIVKLDANSAGGREKLANADWPGATRKRGRADRELLVTFETESARNVSRRKSTQSASEDSENAAQRNLLGRKLATLLHVKELAKALGVRSASANRIVEAQAVPTDPFYLHQRWHYGMANLPAAWDVTTGSGDVTIAIVDSGAIRNHPDLEAKLVDGYDVVDRDSDFADSDDYHGTHVLGTVGAIANNGIGGAGVAWGSRLMPVRVLDGRSGTLYDVLQGVRYAAGLPNDLGVLPSRPADIINLSLGTNLECDPAEAELFAEILARGIHLVAAAGNSHSNSAFSPATCPGVIGVASIGPGGDLAPYSNFGALVDLAAPGGDQRFDSDGDGRTDAVFSTGFTSADGFTFVPMQGTSMAAPHVSGIIALMKSINPSLSPLHLQQLIETGLLTDDVGPLGRDDHGYGNINALKAVRAAAGDFDLPPAVRLTPGVLDFGNVGDSLTFTVTNAGSGLLAVEQIRSTSSSVTIQPLVVNALGLGTYRATASRQDLGAGTHTATMEVDTNVGTTQWPVFISRLPYNVRSRPGHLYIVVANAATGALVAATSVNAPLDYDFRMDDLPPGNYHVFAGTDMNNDGNICDAGELCGAFGSVFVPREIHHTSIVESIDIAIGSVASDRSIRRLPGE